MSPRTASNVARRRRLRRAGAIVVVVGLLGLVVAASAFWFSGGRWFVVRTPSMGTAAPVGSLVLTRPAEVSALRVGDILAYHPPSEPSTTYTHRIVSITAQGLHTRGDINGTTDPWTVTQHDIVGHAIAIPAVGWLFRALPLLIVGGLVIWGLTRMWAGPVWRGPLRTVGAAILFAFVSVTLRPWVNVVQLATRTTRHGAYIQTVSTGLLPVQLAPQHGRGDAVTLSTAGRVGLNHFTGGRPGERYLLDTHLHLSTLQWILAVIVCASPLLWTLIVGYRNDEATVA